MFMLKVITKRMAHMYSLIIEVIQIIPKSTYGNINPYTGKKGTKRYDNYNNYGKNYNENTQTNVTNRRYLSSTLLCNDGYKDINGQCNKLPNVTNGHYFGSTLLCNNGYKDINGQCK